MVLASAMFGATIAYLVLSGSIRGGEGGNGQENEQQGNKKGPHLIKAQ